MSESCYLQVLLSSNSPTCLDAKMKRDNLCRQKLKQIEHTFRNLVALNWSWHCRRLAGVKLEKHDKDDTTAAQTYLPILLEVGFRWVVFPDKPRSSWDITTSPGGVTSSLRRETTGTGSTGSGVEGEYSEENGVVMH